MTKTKIIAALASITLAIGLATPSVFAQADLFDLPFLADVENVVGVAVPSGVALSWDPVLGANGYTVYYDTVSVTDPNNITGLYAEQIENIAETSYVVEDLSPGITYYFAVAAEDTTGTTQGSENYSFPEAEVTPLAAVVVEPEPVVVEPVTPEPVVTPEPIVPEPVDQNPAFILNIPDPAENQVEPMEIHDAAEETAADPEPLPDSGPGVALALAISTGGAYLWRKKKQ